MKTEKEILEMIDDNQQELDSMLEALKEEKAKPFYERDDEYIQQFRKEIASTRSYINALRWVLT